MRFGFTLLLLLGVAFGVAAPATGAGRATIHAHTGLGTPLEPCSAYWAAKVGPEVVAEAWTYSIQKDPEFIAWLLAIAWVESRMHPDARSTAGAVGLMQLTPDGAMEAALACDLPKLTGGTEGRLDAVLDRPAAIVYGSCLVRKYLADTHGNYMQMLTLYNGGYRQLVSYLGHGSMAPETRDYALAVFNARYSCEGGVPK